MHNVHHLLSLMGAARRAILEDRYPDFLKNYFRTLYNGDESKVPKWAITALGDVGVDLLDGFKDR